MESCLTAEYNRDNLLLESDVLKDLTPCRFCYRASDWDLKVEDWNGVHRSFSLCERCLSIIMSKNFEVNAISQKLGFSMRRDRPLIRLPFLDSSPRVFNLLIVVSDSISTSSLKLLTTLHKLSSFPRMINFSPVSPLTYSSYPYLVLEQGLQNPLQAYLE